MTTHLEFFSNRREIVKHRSIRQFTNSQNYEIGATACMRTGTNQTVASKDGVISFLKLTLQTLMQSLSNTIMKN